MERGYSVALDHVTYEVSAELRRKIVEDITFSIPKGQFVAVVGENGAGKSTLLALIAGTLQATSGTVRVGPEIINKPINRILDGVGIVHQADERDIIPHLSIGQNIYLREVLGGGKFKRFFGVTESWKRETRARIAEYTDKHFGLELLASTLSGGERQMLSILIATQFEHKINPCGLLLLDEHTSRLDHKNADWVIDFTVQQIKKANCTAIMVTHRYSEALKYADRILVLRNGNLVKDIDAPRKTSIDEIRSFVAG